MRFHHGRPFGRAGTVTSGSHLAASLRDENPAIGASIWPSSHGGFGGSFDRCGGAAGGIPRSPAETRAEPTGTDVRLTGGVAGPATSGVARSRRVFAG